VIKRHKGTLTRAQATSNLFSPCNRVLLCLLGNNETAFHTRHPLPSTRIPCGSSLYRSSTTTTLVYKYCTNCLVPVLVQSSHGTPSCKYFEHRDQSAPHSSNHNWLELGLFSNHHCQAQAIATNDQATCSTKKREKAQRDDRERHTYKQLPANLKIYNKFLISDQYPSSQASFLPSVATCPTSR
jgi:hypothetical protein